MQQQIRTQTPKKNKPAASLIISWLIILGVYLLLRLVFVIFGFHLAPVVLGGCLAVLPYIAGAFYLFKTPAAHAIAGTFLVVGLTEDDFTSLTPEQIEKFKEKYQSPEIFTLFNGELHVMKMPPEEAKEQKEKQKKDAQQKNPAKGKKKNRSGESR